LLSTFRILYSIRSMNRGVNLGLIDAIPLKACNDSSPSEKYNDDPFFQNILKQSQSKFPAKNLLYHGVVSPRSVANFANAPIIPTSLHKSAASESFKNL